MDEPFSTLVHSGLIVLAVASGVHVAGFASAATTWGVAGVILALLALVWGTLSWLRTQKHQMKRDGQ